MGRRSEEDFNNFHDFEHWPGVLLCHGLGGFGADVVIQTELRSLYYNDIIMPSSRLLMLLCRNGVARDKAWSLRTFRVGDPSLAHARVAA